MPIYSTILENTGLLFLDIMVIFTYSNLLFSVEFYTYNMVLIILILGIIVLIFSIFYFKWERFYVGEYIVLIFLSMFGWYYYYIQMILLQCI